MVTTSKMPKTRRLPTHRRVKNPPSMQLTNRDRAVIQSVRTYRFMRQDQIQALLFPSQWSAQYRLVRLYQHGYLDRLFTVVPFGRGRIIYCLDKRGAALLATQSDPNHSQSDWNRKQIRCGSQFLEHTLAINDVRIAIELGCRNLDCEVLEWIGEGDLKKVHSREKERVYVEGMRGSTQKVAVIADAYFVLQAGNRRAHFFLEVDRGTIANKRWMQRVRAYDAYYRSGKYQARYGTRSLRVLTITTGEKRLGNLKNTTEKAGGGMMYWFATLGDITAASILGKPIWRIAGREGTYPLLEKPTQITEQHESTDKHLTSASKHGIIYCVKGCT